MVVDGGVGDEHDEAVITTSDALASNLRISISDDAGAAVSVLLTFPF